MIHYRFEFDPQTVIEFAIDEQSDTSYEENLTEVPEWMRLDRYRCEGCPLDPSSRTTCPAAMAMKPVVEAFSHKISYEDVKVTVEQHDVRIEAQTTMQNAVRSLLGLLLALSSCPVVGRLRPMAQFHLPFGTREHTVFRAIGMYLTAQFVREQEGQTPDWSIDGLKEIYENVHKVNDKLADRIRAASKQDATVNSIIILDAFGYGVTMSIKNSAKKLKPIFSMYLD